MIWRNQNNGPGEEDRGEPRTEPQAEVRPEPSEPARGGDSRPAMGSVGERVETVLEAAERAAADIRKDAERWAQRHMEETRRRADQLAAQRVQELSSITDDLLARAQAVARQSDELINALDSAGRRALKIPLRQPDDDVGFNSNGVQPVPEMRAQTNGSANSGSSDQRQAGSISDGARLLVTQMAVAGSNRETIASRLREEFGIADPGAMLDEAGL
jgi:cell division septum initiation protein DivIVA